MSTGRPAFGGNSSAEIFDSILNHSPIAPIRLNAALPAELARIINKSLEKDAALRYQHASDLRSDLRRLKRDSDSGRSVPTPSGVNPSAAPNVVVGWESTKSSATSTTVAPKSNRGLIITLAEESIEFLGIAVLFIW